MGNQVFAKYGTTIFEVMSALAREHGAVNLGQGFPDGNGPDDVRQVAARALEDRPNQYPPMTGLLELREAVAAHDRRFYGLELDPAREVLVTSGATEALASCLLGLLNPGDEVVLFEPAYDSYLPIIELAGATPRFVRLEAPDWALDRAALAAAFSDKTALVILNSPMNPSGKVFDESELDAIAELVVAHDAVVVCDEVYEHLTFDEVAHVPLMTRQGMRERCARIGSAGKTFSLTGWKVGYISAPAQLLSSIARAHQYLTFTTPPNLQAAVAYGLGKDDTYFAELRSAMQRKRDLLRHGLLALGFSVASCQGTYFLNADYSGLGFDMSDVDFCRHLAIEAKVATVPTSAFYHDDLRRTVVRFCFCKNDETLERGLANLGDFLR